MKRCVSNLLRMRQRLWQGRIVIATAIRSYRLLEVWSFGNSRMLEVTEEADV